VWAGDGDGNIIEADARKPGAAILRKIPTGGKFRVDELAYDPVHQILMASNDGDSPPFLTFVSAKNGSLLGHYKYSVDQDGMEQPVWVGQTGWFYQNVPGPKNRIDVFDPRKLPNPIMSFRVECSGGLLNLTLSGLTDGPNGRLMTICGSVGGLSLDPRTGKIYKMIPEMADVDQVWYDSGSNRYYFVHRAGRGGGDMFAVGIVDAATETFIEDIPIEGNSHSIAVSAKNTHIFVPVGGKGIFVIAPGR
jgi:hypothetical protein